LGEHPVAVGAGASVFPGVEAVGRPLRGEDGQVGAGERVEPARELGWRLAVDLQARHLRPGVDPGVGAARNGEGSRRAENPLQSRLELALDGALAGLRRPARKAGAVIAKTAPHRGNKSPTLPSDATARLG